MTDELCRRAFLKNSAALAGSALIGGDVIHAHAANAAPIEVPVVDRLIVRVLLDSSHDIFLGAQQVNGVEIQRARGASDFRRSLHNQWGLSLLLESQRAAEPRTLLLDFGYTPEALINNMEILGVDPRRIDALIVSHGHYDHFGGLIGFLQKYRAILPAELKLYAGGEENFCHRLNRAPAQGQFTDFGVLDRRQLTGLRVTTVLADRPTVISGHAFTTGPIQRTGFEKVLPNTMVEYGTKDGLGCDASHFTSAELNGKIVPDEHLHEHATCFNVKDRGLVVITSCGHVGIINTIRQAQQVSGVRKLHALIGGFHLGPAPLPYIAQSVAELKTLEPDVVVPMHCSGVNFVQAMREQMPDKLLISSTGSRISFGG
ncbi:MAG TPA: MBL fold metallo-hydrolase [Alphaproteobacteria bacterium]|nr:MBL fold metallo-hydrolase [Alphaproteobacteria bacterium]